MAREFSDFPVPDDVARDLPVHRPDLVLGCVDAS